MLEYDYPFAQGIYLENKYIYGTVEDVKHKVKQLREDYCFPIVACCEDWKHFRFTVIVSKKCSDIQKEWIKEVVKYHLPVGIVLEIGTHFGKDKVLLEPRVMNS